MIHGGLETQTGQYPEDERVDCRHDIMPASTLKVRR